MLRVYAMMTDYVGFQVELTSTLGKVIGIVLDLSSDKMVLDNATIDDKASTLNPFTIQ